MQSNGTQAPGTPTKMRRRHCGLEKELGSGDYAESVWGKCEPGMFTS